MKKTPIKQQKLLGTKLKFAPRGRHPTPRPVSLTASLSEVL